MFYYFINIIMCIDKLMERNAMRLMNSIRWRYKYYVVWIAIGYIN
jgi:hypothetical protein